MSSPQIKFDLQIKYGSEYGPEEEQAVLQVLRQGAPTSGAASNSKKTSPPTAASPMRGL
jgi:hypothetical protein